MPIFPLAQTRPQELPFNQLSPDRFELLCKRLIEKDPEVETCYLYGKPGEKQFGVDIVACMQNGERWVYQCKRRKEYTRRDLEATLEKLAYQADHFVVLISCMAGVGLRDLIEERPATELWDARDLSDRLKAHPDLVEDFFGLAVREVFCGPLAITLEGYLNSITNYCAHLPYLSLDAPGKSLDDVYVPLLLRRERRQADEDRENQAAPEPPPVRIEQVLADHRRLVILGAPGAGKSSLLRYLAKSAWENHEQIGLDTPHLPLPVPLRRLGDASSSPEHWIQATCADGLVVSPGLPDHFFARWASERAVYWLILLDGLDEVPTERRRALARSIGDWAKRNERHRLIVTSRLDAYERARLDDNTFVHYTLLPFGWEQVKDFAMKWFSDRAVHFGAELSRVRAGELAGTPLLLTIAATVFTLEKGLPKRRTTLYDRFVEIWLTEDEERGLAEKLGEVMVYRRPIIERLARWSMEDLSGGAMSKDAFVQQVATILRDEAGLAPLKVEGLARSYAEIIRERAGLLVQRGTAIDFIHPTFREFLTACAVANAEGRDIEKVWRWIRPRLRNARWRESILLLLGILSDRSRADANELVRRIHATQDKFEDVLHRHLYLAAACIAEGIELDDRLHNQIVSEVVKHAREGILQAQQFDAVNVLAQLTDDARAIDGLLMLVRDVKTDPQVRRAAIDSLSKLGDISRATGGGSYE